MVVNTQVDTGDQTDMSSLCGCFRGETEPPIPLDAEIQVSADCQVGRVLRGPPTQRILGYPLYGARRQNFDFVTHDNGETYIATFRAMERGKVMGCESLPIPKSVFNNFRVIKKMKRGNVYGILLDTGDHDLHHYIHKFTKEELELLGLKDQ